MPAPTLAENLARRRAVRVGIGWPALGSRLHPPAGLQRLRLPSGALLDLDSLAVGVTPELGVPVTRIWPFRAVATGNDVQSRAVSPRFQAPAQIDDGILFYQANQSDGNTRVFLGLRTDDPTAYQDTAVAAAELETGPFLFELPSLSSFTGITNPTSPSLRIGNVSTTTVQFLPFTIKRIITQASFRIVLVIGTAAVAGANMQVSGYLRIIQNIDPEDACPFA